MRTRSRPPGPRSKSSDTSGFDEDNSDRSFTLRWQTPKYHMLAEMKAINGDPLKLTQQVRRYLDKGDDNKALEIARYAGVNMNAVVSWNFIIASEMEKGRLDLAMKRYTEMKKRAQKPDSYTYLTVLRGCAENSDKKRASSYAISVFNAMFASNSACKPTIMHANACINVCARQGDIDGMFGIASRLPSTGPGAADSVTFTTILNAVRAAALPRGRLLSDQSTFRAREDAVFQGRRMWKDIVQRWTTGEISMDEKLIAAMGRLLAVGTRKDDVDDIFSLLEQTMGLTRQPSLLRDQAPKSAGNLSTQNTSELNHNGSLSLLDDTRDQGFQRDLGSTTHSVGRPVLGRDVRPNYSQTSDSEFARVANTGYRMQLAQPGPNTLSLILEACARLHAYKAAAAYWHSLIERMSPERENYHGYLRLLRMSHSSAASLRICETMATSVMSDGSKVGVEPKTFKIAMAACSRDILNLNMLSSAVGLTRLMLKELDEPDLGTAEKFLFILEHKDNRQEGRTMDVLVPALQTVFDLAQKFQTLFESNAKKIGEFRAKEKFYQSTNDEMVSEKSAKTSIKAPTRGGSRKQTLDREAQQDLILQLISRTTSLCQSLRDCHRSRLTDQQYDHISENIGELSNWLSALAVDENHEHKYTK